MQITHTTSSVNPIYVNQSPRGYFVSGSGSSISQAQAQRTLTMLTGDTIKVTVFNTTGANLSTPATAEYGCHMNISLVQTYY